MIFGFLIPLLFLGIVVLVARKLFVRDDQGAPSTFSIRRLFQYVLLFGLLAVTASGVSGLIGRLFDIGRVIAESRTDLARDITFSVIGAPLYYSVARWTRRTLAEDPTERHSFSWNAYLAVISLTALITAMTSGYSILTWALGNETFQGQQLSRFMVWSLIWVFHWQMVQSSSREDESRPHLLLGSLIGLGVTAVGLSNLFSSVARLILTNDEKSLLIQSTNPSVKALSVIIVGLPVWYQYWLRVSVNMKRELLWYSYVMLAGIAGGFIAFIASTSVIMYDVLVWFFGDTFNNSASQHFSDSIGALGSALVGIGVWWYHAQLIRSSEIREGEDRAIVQREGRTIMESARSEMRRVYEYIVSGISLIAAAAGLMMVLVAALESITPGELVSTTSSRNTLLVAVTLIITGSPVWWFFWNRIESHIAVDGHEQSSPTRRIFLLMLFGVSAIASVISVITGVFIFLDDLLNSQLGGETVRQMRYAIAILLANGAISWYHWSIYRHERAIQVRKPKSERLVVLVGPKDSSFAKEIQDVLGGRVQMWDSHDGLVADGEIPWEREKVIELIKASDSSEVMILNEKRKLRAIPFHRV